MRTTIIFVSMLFSCSVLFSQTINYSECENRYKEKWNQILEEGKSRNAQIFRKYDAPLDQAIREGNLNNGYEKHKALLKARQDEVDASNAEQREAWRQIAVERDNCMNIVRSNFEDQRKKEAERECVRQQQEQQRIAKQEKDAKEKEAAAERRRIQQEKYAEAQRLQREADERYAKERREWGVQGANNTRAMTQAVVDATLRGNNSVSTNLGDIQAQQGVSKEQVVIASSGAGQGNIPKRKLQTVQMEEEEKKEWSDTDIKKIVEKCVTASDFCSCVHNNFPELTGVHLSGKNSQIRNETDIANNKMFNEYLRDVSKGVDDLAERQRNYIDKELKKIDTKIAEKYQSEKMLDMAKMASFVYHKEGRKLPEGWGKSTDNSVQSLLKLYNNHGVEDDGFHAEIYQKEGTKEYVLAFRGTDDLRDWVKGNIPQGLGISTTQYSNAINLIQQFKETCKDCSISITGHSLGGGLASAAGVVSELPTYTFNAAGVHENTIPSEIRNNFRRNAEKNVKAYYSNDDELNQIQDKYAESAKNYPKTTATTKKVFALASGMPDKSVDELFDIFPPALGKRIPLGDTGGHGIQELINTLEKEKTPLQNQRSQIDINTNYLKMGLSDCFASE